MEWIIMRFLIGVILIIVGGVLTAVTIFEHDQPVVGEDLAVVDNQRQIITFLL